MAAIGVETLDETYPDTPSGNASRWKAELESSDRWLEQHWHERCGKIVKRYLDEREGEERDKKKLNLFPANVQMQRAITYGLVPSVSVERRFGDSSDDVARVASDMLERLLNTDIERAHDSYATSLDHALFDRILCGFGNVWARYAPSFETVEAVPAQLHPVSGAELAPEVPEHQQKIDEDVEFDYVHWKDQRWNPCKVSSELRWWARKAEMTRDQLRGRFTKPLNGNQQRSKLARAAMAERGDGEKLTVGDVVPLNAKRDSSLSTDARKADPWSRAEVWEIWDKENRKVWWISKAWPTPLDVLDDPLGLEGFFPFPPPQMANATTSRLVPFPDYALAQDQYVEVDDLTNRINLLQDGIRAAGLYDATAGEDPQRLFKEFGGNILIPVQNWMQLKEKGGLAGIIEWVPLQAIVSAIEALSERRREVIENIYEVTGWSDIMRGQANTPNVTATEQGIKAQFGSVRMQALQDQFAAFATGLQRIKAEIIAKHFDPDTIIARSNIMFTADAEQRDAAVELLKSRYGQFRVAVKPESVSVSDFAKMKSERMGAVSAIAEFFTSAAPMMQAMPAALPFMLEILQWAFAGIKGGSQMESILDRGIEGARNQPPAAQAPGQKPQGPDPRVAAEMLKGQNERQKVQAELQADLVREQAKSEADSKKEEVQRIENVREAAAKTLITHAGRAVGVALAPPKPTGLLPGAGL